MVERSSSEMADVLRFVGMVRALLRYTNPCNVAEDQSQQWQVVAHECDVMERGNSRLAQETPDLVEMRQAGMKVIDAACRVVAADTYVHPILSRADAVKAGVAELHDAVGKWHGVQPASSAVTSAEGK